MATTEYDAVLKARKFADVYDADKGWQIDSPDDMAALKEAKHTVRVAPIGHFNIGKTFVVNKLSGKSLATGEQHHTEGLSIAVSPASGGQIVWVDTAGLDSPVVHSESLLNATEGLEMAPADLVERDQDKAVEHTHKLIETLQGELRENKRLEDFHRAVAFDFADVFLFVIGLMSYQDQLNIMLLVKQINLSQRGSKRVYVVHNLKDWSKAQLEKTRGDGYNYIERVKALFFMQKSTVTAEGVVDADMALVVEGKQPKEPVKALNADIEKLHGVFGQDPRSTVQMHHVFLCDDAQEKEYNAAVFAHLRSAVTATLGDKQTVKGALEHIVTQAQGQFAEVGTRGEAPPPLRMVRVGDGKWRAHSVAASAPTVPKTEEVHEQPLELPSYLTLGSDDLQYNVVRFTGRMPSKKEGLAMQKKTMAGVQIALPGMTPDDVEKIRERVRFTGTDPALRLEAVEGVRTLVIDLEAVERVMPEHFLRKMWDESQSDEQLVERQSEPLYVHSPAVEVISEGTRSVFQDNERPVRVQVRTGLSNVSTLSKPVVAYNDGILSIVVATSEKVK